MFVSSNEAICELAKKSKVLERTPMTYRSLGSLIGYKGIILADDASHDAMRPCVAHALSMSRLHAMYPEFMVTADKCVDSLMSTANNALQTVREYTYELILTAMFGRSVTQTSQYADMKHAYFICMLEPPANVLRRTCVQMMLPFMPATWFGYREDLRLKIRTCVAELCESAMYKKEGFLCDLMCLGKEEMRDCALSFLLAGQATSSIAICWTLQLLATHEHWQKLLFDELRTSDLSPPSLTRLPVLDAIVKESLRLYPPLFYISRISKGPLVLDGYDIPVGTHVRIPVLALQRRRDVWGDDADTFNPRRFMCGREKGSEACLWAFFAGKRGCVGKGFAMLEIKCFVARIVGRCFVSGGEVGVCCGANGTPRDLKIVCTERE